MNKLTEFSKKYGGNPYLRSIINLVPYIGGSLDVILTEKWNSFYQRRIENMLDQLSHDLTEVQEKINDEYLESEEFFDIIQKIIQESIKTRLDYKRKIYSKIIRDSISYQKSTAETESIIEVVSNLYENDLFLIFQLQIYLTNETKDNFTGEDIFRFLSSENIDINEIVRALYRFAFLGLLDYKTNELTLRHKIQFNKTPFFDRIHNYLIE